MTKENSLKAYLHYKKLLEANEFKKEAWKKNAEHAIKSIREKHLRKYKRDIEEEFKEEKPKKNSKEK